MFRLGVISLVAVGWLISQLGATPHVHGDGRAHESQPHFHIGVHSHGKHHHSHSPPRRSSERKTASLIASDDPHDADACYAAGQNSPTSIGGEKLTLGQIDNAAIGAIGCDGSASLDLFRFEHPPDIASHGPLRFLILRTLRI